MSLYLGENLISGQATLVGESRNIGQIIPSTIPLTDAGLHLLDGSLIQGSGIYSAFVDYIAGLVSTYPDLFTTESDWQSTVTQYGVCGKFVYDATANTVRLPKVTGIIEGTTDVSALGDLVEAGLPNIEGFLGFIGGGYAGYWGNGTGALSNNPNSGSNQLTGGSSSGTSKDIIFDASRSSSIYGNSTTVQPQTIKAFYYIVIATSTKTDIQVDIDEIATDLNGKVDKSSLQEVQCVVETYVNGASWYRVYSDGWCEQGGKSNSYVSNTTRTININLLKTFSSTDYSIQLTNFGNSSYGINGYIDVYSQTVSDFIVGANTASNNNNTNNIYWQACGYIEV